MRVLGNLAVAFVILGLFHIVDTAVQTVIVSIFVLIYALVMDSFWALWRAQFTKWDQDLVRFIGRARLFQRSNVRIYEEMRKDYQQDLESMRLSHRVDTGFNTLFALIALGNLIYAVFS